MRSLFVLIGISLMIACGERQPPPLAPADSHPIQRGQIVTAEGAAVSGAQVVIIDPERLKVLARAAGNANGHFVVSVPYRPSYYVGVTAPYMPTHLDTAFAFTGDVITVDGSLGRIAGKAAQAARRLGDVNNDAKVDIADALFVLLYTLDRASFVAPNQGDITLGDVNQDGAIDQVDVLLIMTYIMNPLDPALPDGIGSVLETSVESDREVLLAFYEATGGDWANRTHWRSDVPLSQWQGVRTDDQGHVTRLYLSHRGLTGTIPAALGKLENLQTLDLAHNQLTGEIPEQLGQLKNLRELYLDGNQLTGEIPITLGLLENLQILYLQENKLTGEIPTTLGQLENLLYLYLQENELTGEIPTTLGQLENLQILDLQENKLTGEIPVALGQLKNLLYLYLRENELTGEIPVALGQLENLRELYLGGNELTGEIPVALERLKNLQTLDLRENKLTGKIPVALGQLENLRELYLADNQLTGEIPEHWGHLQHLYLAGNQLTGCIPFALRGVAYNDFGSLGLDSCPHPSFESYWTALIAFYEATGGDGWWNRTHWRSDAPLGEWYGVTMDKREDITGLELSDNGLTGEIPKELGQLENLQVLSLSQNKLTGQISKELGQLERLGALYLQENELTGEIPEQLGQLERLGALYLQENELTGEIPKQLG